MEMELGKLFIGGISWDTNEDRLRAYFQVFGEVVEAVIMKDRVTGRARGFGFIVFADPAVAERVVMQKHMIDGRTVEAKKAVPRDDQNIQSRNNCSIHESPGPARTKKIFVGGLASTVTESDFKKYFDQFGTITDVVVMYDHNTHRPRGFGFITYDSEEAVDKVLLKTFHELSGKMVEVKRAVPKELSPGPNRNQLRIYNYGPSRFNCFINGYTHGYTLSSIGGYGGRIDGRYSPVTVGRSGFLPIGSDYGMGLNFEPTLSPSYGGGGNLSSSLSCGRVVNPSFIGNSNWYSIPVGYGVGNEGSNPVLGSPSRNLWGSGNRNCALNSGNANTFLGLGSGTSGVGSLGSLGALWDSSPDPSRGRGAGSVYSSGSLSYGIADPGTGSGAFGRNGVRNVAPASLSKGVYDEAYDDICETGLFYGDSSWKSSSSELEGSDFLGFGLGATASHLIAKDSVGYVGGYGVTNRQANSGIAV